MSELVAQLRAVLFVLVRSGLNAVRRRQSRSGALVLALLLGFLALQLWRLGALAARGTARVLRYGSPALAQHYTAFWLTALVAAVLALKLARGLPIRGQPRVFDTVLFRSLPMRPAARAVAEWLVAAGHGALFALLVLVPLVYGVARAHHGALAASAFTGLVYLLLLAWTALLTEALRTTLAFLASRVLTELARVLTFAVAFASFMGFVLAGPTTANPDALESPPLAGSFLLAPGRALVGALAGLPPEPHGALALALGALVPAALALLALRFTVGLPAEALERRGSARAGLGRGFVGPLATQFRMLQRQAPTMLLAAPGVLLFLLALKQVLPPRNTLARELGAGLSGWMMSVGGIAVVGAAVRRERRVQGFWLALRAHQRTLLASTTAAAFLVLSPLALAPLLFRAADARWTELASQSGAALVVLALVVSCQSSMAFLLLDPAPERLSGLSVPAALAVTLVGMPALVLLVGWTFAPLWLGLLATALYGLFAWALFRAAEERLRWVLDPDGDPYAAAHAWLPLRALGASLAAQVLALWLLARFEVPMPALLAGTYATFVAVLVPWATAGRRRLEQALGHTPRWSRARSVLAGVLGGLCTLGLALVYLRFFARGVQTQHLPLARALREAGPAWTALLLLIAAVAAPLAEESLFRGWLQPALAQDLPRRARWVAVPLAAALFAVVHPTQAWVPVGVAGLAAGLLRARSGRLLSAVVLHMTHNGLVLAVSLAAAR